MKNEKELELIISIKDGNVTGKVIDNGESKDIVKAILSKSINNNNIDMVVNNIRDRLNDIEPDIEDDMDILAKLNNVSNERIANRISDINDYELLRIMDIIIDNPEIDELDDIEKIKLSTCYKLYYNECDDDPERIPVCLDEYYYLDYKLWEESSRLSMDRMIREV